MTLRVEGAVVAVVTGRPDRHPEAGAVAGSASCCRARGAACSSGDGSPTGAAGLTVKSFTLGDALAVGGDRRRADL
jgi:hypothetical protein